MTLKKACKTAKMDWNRPYDTVSKAVALEMGALTHLDHVEDTLEDVGHCDL